MLPPIARRLPLPMGIAPLITRAGQGFRLRETSFAMLVRKRVDGPATVCNALAWK